MKKNIQLLQFLLVFPSLQWSELILEGACPQQWTISNLSISTANQTASKDLFNLTELLDLKIMT